MPLALPVPCLSKQCLVVAYCHEHSCKTKALAEPVAHRSPAFVSATQPTGIAPLTTQSGKQRYVSSRWACSKFLRQTFHEFAGLSIKKSRWAKAFYQSQLARHKSPQVARRALAYKWLRIIYRCWQTGESYDEDRYVQRLGATNSPLADQLKAPTA